MAGESEMHRRLKQQIFLWAYERGYRCSAMEVRAPRSRFIVDLAGIRFDRMESQPTVAVFECKQSREDLKRDNRRTEVLKEKLAALQERRETLERLLAIHYPSLRTTEWLFAEWSTFDFDKIDHAAYRQTVRKIDCIHRQLFDHTKFDQMNRYKLADLHYLVTIPGLLLPSEVPLGWGLIETDCKGAISEKVAPTRFEKVNAMEWLKRIAAAATRRNLKMIAEQEEVEKRSPGQLFHS